MSSAYHENRTHGTAAFPLQVYSQHDAEELFFVSQHWHEEFEWIYVEQGVLNLTLHGKTCQLQTGDFCFINAGELHEIKSIGRSLHHAIVFQPELLDFALYDSCQHSFIRPVTGGKLLFPASCSSFSSEDRSAIVSHMLDIVRLYRTLPVCAHLSIRIHLLCILEILFQSDSFLENAVSPKREDAMKKLKEVIEYIHTNYAKPISLKALAEICFMSPNYFCHYFRQEIGKPPIAFINEYRIQKACQMLSESDLPVSQVSAAVGFDNISYFIRKFREYRQVSPKEYRTLYSEISRP